MRFYYNFSKEALNEINLDSIGNFALLGRNDDGAAHILICTTRLGITNIFKCGPFVEDIKLLPKTCSIMFKRINFNQNTLLKTIKEFLTNPFARLSQVEEIDKKEALKLCPNINNIFENILIENGDDEVAELMEEVDNDD